MLNLPTIIARNPCSSDAGGSSRSLTRARWTQLALVTVTALAAVALAGAPAEARVGGVTFAVHTDPDDPARPDGALHLYPSGRWLFTAFMRVHCTMSGFPAGNGDAFQTRPVSFSGQRRPGSSVLAAGRDNDVGLGGAQLRRRTVVHGRLTPGLQRVEGLLVFHSTVTGPPLEVNDQHYDPVTDCKGSANWTTLRRRLF